jgi:Zn-dependent protease/CBS domain-containing protein
MHGALSLGKIFNIDIKIDWSWLFIFLLILWNLAVLFGHFHPDWGAGLRWGLAFVASLLFFLSVLAHELAHSVVANAQGVTVKNITLFLFGGVSNLQRQPPSPWAEFLITIVGPLTSFVIGFVLLVLSGVAAVVVAEPGISQPLDLMARLGPVTIVLFWLGWINLLLAIFNLIPGFPLDGGRVLRSVLWAISGNLRQATRWAAWVGQAIAWMFIVAGAAMIFGIQLPFFGQGLVGGIWLAFIGWFLNAAAIQSYQQVAIQDVLQDVPVRELMRPDPPTVAATCLVSELVHDHVMQSDDHAFPVVGDGRLKGLVTLEDIRTIPRDHWDTTPVEEIMTPVGDLTVVGIDDDAADALTQLIQQDVRQLPVLSGDSLVGLVRRRDIMRWLKLQSDIK